MRSTTWLWRGLAIVFVLSFAALGYLGREIYLAAPPIPKEVRGADGALIFSGPQIRQGQQAWFKAGGQQLGTVWGHGSYVAPDWSADWLHREATGLRDVLAGEMYARQYLKLTETQRAAVDLQVTASMRANTYDPSGAVITLSKERSQVVATVAAHYEQLFGSDPALTPLRIQYAMPDGALPAREDREALAAFFFWSSWSAVTDRPGRPGVSYTSNWPYEPAVGNTMTSGSAIWTMASIIMLLAGIAAMVWWHSAHAQDGLPVTPPAGDPLLQAVATPSMKATGKYFFVVIGLFLTQIAMGALTAHYAVEGRTFFGVPIAQVLPYTVSRSIHTQFGILWIATAWLATGLFVAPLLSGSEPKHQKLGVDVLFYALLLIVVGSTACSWLGSLSHAGFHFDFWFGAQGLEYTNMGRIWQILLFVGLLFWLFLLARALWAALKKPSESRGLLAMVLLSATCIGSFYATSLAWGQNTHYSMIEYWRWWLVHLWVEGFFEVFATAVVALIFTRLGLVSARSATSAVIAETTVFLFGGILGTLHHLYWTGTPTSVIAVGAVFSALEVVPLALLGIEGWQNYQRSKAVPWVSAYRWPILFFVAVGFWNTVGAGLLGFTINPPASLYYVQGLNLTPAHGHGALFGVYGMLGIGLTLFCLRGLFDRLAHADRLLAWCFWTLNIGLAMMVFITLVPAGIYQASAAISKGLWYARSPEIVHSPVMETLVWLRVPGDIVFGAGGVLLAVYAAALLLPRRRLVAMTPRSLPVCD